MSEAKAQISKQKGNEAFKAGDYVNAIGFYTSAMLDDPKDVTFPLNRAAAYLKLGKNEDAVRDCSTALKVSPKNPKAYFRRAQARIAMVQLEEAQQDLTEAAKLAPQDGAIQTAMSDVQTKLEAKRNKAQAVSLAKQHVDADGAPPKRRRVPITIIEAEKPVPPTASTDGLTPVSSRSLKPTTDDSKASPSPSTSFKEAKSARETARPSRVGGGIFRANGASTVFPTRETASPGPETTKPASFQAPASEVPPVNEEPVKEERTVASAPTPAALITKPTLKAPETLFQLVRMWNTRETSEEQWEVLQTIPPAKFPALCKTSLDPTFLSFIFVTLSDTLAASPSEENKTKVREYMECLPLIDRFDMVYMFLSGHEKNIVKSIWKELGVDWKELGGAWGKLLK